METFQQMELYQIGGALSTIDLIYRIQRLRKDGCDIVFTGSDQVNPNVFYIKGIQNGSTMAEIKVSLKSMDKELRSAPIIDEHFLYTDIPTRISKNTFSYTDFVNLTNIYSRLCAYNVLFTIIGSGVVEKYENYRTLLFVASETLKKPLVREFLEDYFIGKDDANWHTFCSLIENFDMGIQNAIKKMNYTGKKYPGKGRSKALILHAAFANVMSLVITGINDPEKKYNLDSWNTDSMLSSVMDKEYSSQIKYVALESFVLFRYLINNALILTGLTDSNYEKAKFMLKFIDLGIAAEDRLHSVGEDFGIIIDREVVNFQWVDKVVMKTKNKLRFDVEKSKFCLRCSKHYLNYFLPATNLSHIETGYGTVDTNLLNVYAAYFGEQITKKDSATQDYIYESIVNKIISIMYTLTPTSVCIKSMERLVSYNAILRWICHNKNINNDTVYVGIAYSDAAILYYMNVWMLNDETKCIKHPKEKIRLMTLAMLSLRMNIVYVEKQISYTSNRGVTTNGARLTEQYAIGLSYLYREWNGECDKTVMSMDPYDNTNFPNDVMPFFMANGLYCATISESKYPNMKIYDELGVMVMTNSSNKEPLIKRLMESASHNDIKNDEKFYIMSIDNKSKLNYVIYKNIQSLYKSTNFSLEEKAFIIFCCIAKIMVNVDDETKKISSISKESLDKTYDVLKSGNEGSKLTLKSLLRG